MAEFQPALEKLLVLEGGYSPQDAPGAGEVNFGITERFLRNIRYPKKPRDLTREEAAKIYYDHFWKPLGLDRIGSQRIATMIFAQAVNGGPSRAIAFVYQVLLSMGVKITPVRSVLTDQAVKALDSVSVDEFTEKYRNRWRSYYRVLAAFNPEYAKFLPGWMNRLREL